mgnify:CR=1 FL=1
MTRNLSDRERIFKSCKTNQCYSCKARYNLNGGLIIFRIFSLPPQTMINSMKLATQDIAEIAAITAMTLVLPLFRKQKITASFIANCRIHHRFVILLAAMSCSSLLRTTSGFRFPPSGKGQALSTVGTAAAAVKSSPTAVGIAAQRQEAASVTANDGELRTESNADCLFGNVSEVLLSPSNTSILESVPTSSPQLQSLYSLRHVLVR